MDFESKDPSSNLGGTSFFVLFRRATVARTNTFVASNVDRVAVSSELTMVNAGGTLLTVRSFVLQPQAFEEAHLAARAMTVLLKCLEKEGTNISQSFVWLFLQVLHGYTVPEEDMKLGCVSVAAANLVHNLTDFQRHFALLSFMKALVSSDNNIILFTEGSLKIPLLLSFFEIIKELYSRLEDTQLVYQYFQGTLKCVNW